MDVIYMDDLKKAKRKAKWREFTESIKNKAIEVEIWARQNPTAAIAGASALASGAFTLIKCFSGNAKAKEERRVKEMYCYDPSLGCYYELKRKMKNSERLELERRRKNGESYGQILNDLRILK